MRVVETKAEAKPLTLGDLDIGDVFKFVDSYPGKDWYVVYRDVDRGIPTGGYRDVISLSNHYGD